VESLTAAVSQLAETTTTKKSTSAAKKVKVKAKENVTKASKTSQ